MRKSLRTILCIPFLLYATATFAGEDLGAFVTQSDKGANFVSGGQATQAIPAFAKLYAGTQVTLSAEAKLQLVYLDGGRQEFWEGPARFVIGANESIPDQGSAAPKSKSLPPFMVAALTKSPEVIQDIKQRQGMIRVRSLLAAKKIQEAERHYASLRAVAAEEDITPEIYLLTTLDQYKSYKKMRVPLEEILRRQPNNEEARALYDQFIMLMELEEKELPASD